MLVPSLDKSVKFKLTSLILLDSLVSLVQSDVSLNSRAAAVGGMTEQERERESQLDRSEIQAESASGYFPSCTWCCVSLAH